MSPPGHVFSVCRRTDNPSCTCVAGISRGRIEEAGLRFVTPAYSATRSLKRRRRSCSVDTAELSFGVTSSSYPTNLTAQAIALIIAILLYIVMYTPQSSPPVRPQARYPQRVCKRAPLTSRGSTSGARYH